MSLLEQKRSKNGWAKKMFQPNLNEGNSKKYKFNVIYNNEFNVNKSKDHLLSFYYLVSWKDYQEKKNTWEPVLIVQHL